MNKQNSSTKQENKKEVKEMKPVLIVEDEPIMRESLRDWLKEEGYEVDTAEKGEEALEKIDQKEFGVVVLDLRLPGKDGLEVLKEATLQHPKLKGIIITAYPSVETAVEAMKIGAADYMAKPFSPDALEKAIEEVLGPIQVKIIPQETKIKEAAAEAPVEEAVAEAQIVEEAKVEEIIPITEEEIPTHFEQGKTAFEIGHYDEALREFLSIVDVGPSNIEARLWIQKTRDAIAKPKPEAGVEVAEGIKECLWSKMGMVSLRICTRDYDCLTCEFDQMMQDKIAAGEAPGIDEALEKFKELPGTQRLCRYAIKGDVSYRLCSRLFQCATCEFAQSMENAMEKKVAKLAARREALSRKAEKASA